ncbi:MAG: hypothetical protein AAGG51_26915 [Cyanobacteria bacterium P01_G01_bin.54]
MTEFQELIAADAMLILPMATIYETGNYIARLSDGDQRREFATIFANEVRRAINGESPWQVLQAPQIEEIRAWLDKFPYFAGKTVSLADLSMIKDWEKARAREQEAKRHPNTRVFIWSLDRQDLSAYDDQP